MSRQRGRGLRLVAVVVITILLLLPFVNRAFHVDDTLFLYSARQILKNPLRPYDFMLTWNVTEEHMWQVTMNPPLACYYSAAVTGLFGEREVPLHLAYLLAALAASLGTYWLASRTSSNPFWSAVILVVCPGFLVTATGVSSDTLTLALYVLAVAAFVHGSQQNSWSVLMLAGVLGGLATVSKYLGITVVPLLAVYSVLREKRISARLLVLLIPLVVFAAWGAHGMYYYGQPHFLQACAYRSKLLSGAPKPAFLPLARHSYFLVMTASFFAGALGPSIFLSLCVCKRRLWGLVVSVAAASVTGITVWLIRGFFGTVVTGSTLPILLIFACGAGSFFCHCFRGIRSWSAERWLLTMWLTGILVFCAFFNWAVAVRVVLFSLPPAAILLGIAIQNQDVKRAWVIALVGVTALLALAVATADYRWAGSYRSAARKVAGEFKGEGNTLYFHAHWGLQFYMEKAGGKYLVWSPKHGQYDDIKSGDQLLLVLKALQNPSLQTAVDQQWKNQTMRPLWESVVYPFLGIHTQSNELRTGFYLATGPVPYSFSTRPCEIFVLFEQL